MRLIRSNLLAAAAICAATAAHAQSAYDYPWCAFYGDRSGGTGCYFTSYQQCMVTLSGIGGNCYRSPYYRGAPAKAPRRGRETERY
jgi:hypothetical protein